MFQPPLFSETRTSVMHALMRAHPFALLVTAEGEMTADHIPFILHEEGERGVLRGHLAAGNPLCGADEPVEALAVFQGAQAYVTPSWYPSKKAHGKVVPTWNYAVVHARGPLRFERDTAWLMAHLNALTDAQESHRAKPWAVADAPSDFIARQLKGLVGIEIPIHRLEGKWKVSQNRPEADRAGVADGVAPSVPDMAAMVRQAGAEP